MTPASEHQRRTLAADQHATCFACRPITAGGLGLDFSVQPDQSVAADWTCPSGGESYPGIIHGGLLATALDGAMVHALFARGIVARTGELIIRYHHPVPTGQSVVVTARLCDASHALHRLEAEVSQGDRVCARARAKFMAVRPASTPAPIPTAGDAPRSQVPP